MRLLSLLAALGAAAVMGCAPTVAQDYFRLEVGNSWEYFVVEGGTDGETWYLEALDADDNDMSGRGDVYLRMMQELPDDPGSPFFLRRFNIRHEQDLTGSTPVSIGWSYRWVEKNEGDRDEWFVTSPGSDSGWTDSWSYSVQESGAGSEFEHEVTAGYCTEEVAASYATTDDCVEVERTITTVNHSLGEDAPDLVTVHIETWAAGVGLLRYRILESDGQTKDAVLRTASFVDE